MCTISWILGQESTHIFFNRDEQKTRDIAKPPAIFDNRDCLTMMPLDPVGGGSWLVANEYGWTFALLNYYQGRLPKGKLLSRGHIVRQLSVYCDFNQILQFMESISLNKYSPFSLLCFAPVSLTNSSAFPPNQDVLTNTVTMLRWTGKELQVSAQASPLFSSAVKFDEVVSARTEHVHRRLLGIVDTKERVAKHLELHCSHEPEASEYSICMHREDAHTVSFSHIHVSQHEIAFNYHNGAPCLASEVTRLAIKRK